MILYAMTGQRCQPRMQRRALSLTSGEEDGEAQHVHPRMGYPPPQIAGSSNTSSWSGMIGEMSGGQHRVDEVTRTESRGLDKKNNPRIAAHRPPKETAGLRNAGVCANETKKESNTLDVADFVRDVAKSSYHRLSQVEIVGDNPRSAFHIRSARGIR